jgi:hypothetical protein
VAAAVAGSAAVETEAVVSAAVTAAVVMVAG